MSKDAKGQVSLLRRWARAVGSIARFRSPRRSAATPLPNTYWVVPGRLLAGEHPSGIDDIETRERLARLYDAGMDYFVDLTEERDIRGYRQLLADWAIYFRSPIVDTSVPDKIDQMVAVQSKIRDAIAAGRGVYVHCRAGIGRTGLTVGCYLVEIGLDGDAALEHLNLLWRKCARSKTWARVPQTPDQAEYIREWPVLRERARKPPPLRALRRSP